MLPRQELLSYVLILHGVRLGISTVCITHARYEGLSWNESTGALYTIVLTCYGIRHKTTSKVIYLKDSFTLVSRKYLQCRFFYRFLLAILQIDLQPPTLSIFSNLIYFTLSFSFVFVK